MSRAGKAGGESSESNGYGRPNAVCFGLPPDVTGLRSLLSRANLLKAFASQGGYKTRPYGWTNFFAIHM
jgi:hypothetical protein